MTSTSKSFETVWELCNSNGRVCPMPTPWNQLFKMLKDTKQNSDGGWTPSLPLILNAWHETSSMEKQLRFKEHIQWASDNNQLEEIENFLRSLTEDDWLHDNGKV